MDATLITKQKHKLKQKKKELKTIMGMLRRNGAEQETAGSVQELNEHNRVFTQLLSLCDVNKMYTQNTVFRNMN